MATSLFRRQIQAFACVVAVMASAMGGLAFDTKWHADATRLAMEQHGFSAEARLRCQCCVSVLCG